MKGFVFSASALSNRMVMACPIISLSRLAHILNCQFMKVLKIPNV